jgi:hypothetical protein
MRDFTLVLRGALFCALALLLGSSLRAQRTWVVDNRAGPNHDFTALMDAIAAAAPGDYVHVRASTVPYSLSGTITKGLRIVGLGAARVPLNCYDPILTIPAGQLFVLHNFEATSFGFDDFPFRAIQSHGLTLLSVFFCTPSNSLFAAAIDSRQLVIVDSWIDSVAQALSIRNSGLHLQNTNVTSHANDPRPVIEHTMYAERSRVTVVGGWIRGGDGYSTCEPPSYRRAGWGYNPVATQSYLAAAARFEGGVDQGNCSSGTALGLIQGSCIPGTDLVAVDPLTTANSTIDRFCEPYGVLFDHEFPAVIPGPARRGQPQTLQLFGPSQSVLALFASLATPFEPIRLPVGDVWLDPYLTVHVGSAAVNAQRRASLGTNIPNWLPIGEVLVFQVAALSPSASFELSPPGFAVVH